LTAIPWVARLTTNWSAWKNLTIAPTGTTVFTREAGQNVVRFAKKTFKVRIVQDLNEIYSYRIMVIKQREGDQILDTAATVPVPEQILRLTSTDINQGMLAPYKLSSEKISTDLEGVVQVDKVFTLDSRNKSNSVLIRVKVPGTVVEYKSGEVLGTNVISGSQWLCFYTNAPAGAANSYSIHLNRKFV